MWESLLAPSLDSFRLEVREWLDSSATLRPVDDNNQRFGVGSDSVALFHHLSHEDERGVVDAHRQWIRRKFDAGFANVSWEQKWGGRGLPQQFEHIFDEEERRYVVPPLHECVGITRGIIAPTIREIGTESQRERFLRPMLRGDEVWCQLFSEPSAGSDLAGLSTTATRDGSDWLINGQKVWTSGAQFADWGYIICRTNPDAPKHQGLTAFLVPMTAQGVDVRPLRQMTGGSSFNEVFFTDVRVPDENRLGDVGAGWRVALTTLRFERSFSKVSNTLQSTTRLIDLAQHLGVNNDPHIRQLLASAYTCEVLQDLTGRRVRASIRSGELPGPEGSIGKVFRTDTYQLLNRVATAILGPRLIADTGEWGTFAWAEHVVGTPGWRVAGGTDEIQRNIIAEQVLQLPREPRLDKDVPFRERPR
ncbi:acyl-CoA dehydrogenase family protein [Nocardia sp. SC052]|uniref:acyl-CoA dehydrogenase family protein n=1 Tax=Nocardia sichangensis TaxID=3385975 RepID=UPI0039A1A39B